jgi:hypothetical protein
VSLVAAGCTRGPELPTASVPERQVAQLPAKDKWQVVSAERAVAVGEQNLATARQAREEALDFRWAAQQELKRSRQRYDALPPSSESERQAERARLLASAAKVDYAEDLVQLRDQRLEEANDAVRLAKADVNVTKVRLLERRDLAEGIDVTRIADEQQRARQKLADDRWRIARTLGQVAHLRSQWEMRHNAALTASRTSFPERAPPPPPQMLPEPK